MATPFEGLACEPISRTRQHRPATTTDPSSDEVLSSRSPPSASSWSLFAECAALAWTVARFRLHCFPDAHLRSTSTPACPHVPTLRSAIHELARRESRRSSRTRGSDQNTNCRESQTAPLAGSMHRRSFDSCSESEGWTIEDAAAKSRLRTKRSGTMHMHTARADSPITTHPTRHRRKRRISAISPSTAICAFLVGSISTAMAQQCISLANSTACQAFGNASISTGSAVAALFPFLSSVQDIASFDSGIESYIAGDFTEER